MNKLVTSCLLSGWVGLLLLSGCGDKEKAAPAIIGTWEETEQIVTNYDAQNQAQSPYVLTTTAGQLFTLRTDGTFEYVTKASGTLSGAYTYSGETIVATRPVPSGATRTFSLKVLEASTTKLRLQEEVAGGSTRSVVETRYFRK